MAEKTPIDPGWAWAKKYRISQAVRVGQVLYISGQVAYDANGQVVGRGDMKEQARQAFCNIRHLLEKTGATMDDVVKITAYLTDISRYNEYAEARREAFPGIPPTSTTVTVSKLVDPDLLVEVEATAYLKS